MARELTMPVTKATTTAIRAARLEIVGRSIPRSFQMKHRKRIFKSYMVSPLALKYTRDRGHQRTLIDDRW